MVPMELTSPRRAAILLALAAAATLGCDKSFTAEDFADSFSSGYCDLVYRCCTAAERLQENISSTDVASCQAAYQHDLDTTAKLTAERESGVAYDESGAQACVNALKAASCADLTNGTLSMACAGSYRGLSGVGQICFDDGWCVSGLVCAFEGDSESGLCHAPLQLGNSCEGSCGPGLFCDSTQLICSALGDIGANCTVLGQCASRYCAPDPTGGTNRTCAAPPPLCTGA